MPGDRQEDKALTTQHLPRRNDPRTFRARDVYLVAIVHGDIIPFHCLEPSAKSPHTYW